MSRRTRIDIINDLLVAIQEKGGTIKPTHLMYKANLSNKLLHEYLRDLESKNLVERCKDKDATVIRITDTGFGFVQQFKKMKEFQSAFGL